MAYVLSAWPLLLCPVAMGAMMWFMMRGMSGRQDHAQARPPYPPYIAGDQYSFPAGTPDERLLAEPNTDDGRSDAGHLPLTSADDRSSQERYADLRARLASVEQQQRRLARELAALDAPANSREGVSTGARSSE